VIPAKLHRDVDNAFIQRVGAIKIEERVSFANAFALTLPERLQMPLLTTDHHVFDSIKKQGHFRFPEFL
jgi:predicted nucleic acid-binding protein